MKAITLLALKLVIFHWTQQALVNKIWKKKFIFLMLPKFPFMIVHAYSF